MPDWDDRSPWAHQAGSITADEILRGSDGAGFAVVSAVSVAVPSKEDLKRIWKAKGRTGSTLVAVRYQANEDNFFAFYGPEEDDFPVFGVSIGIAEQLIQDAIRAESPIRLRRDLRTRLQTMSDAGSAGIRNEGLFASHILDLQPETAPNWAELCLAAKEIRSLRGEELLTGLGYKVESVGDGSVLLERAGGQRRAAAVVLRGDESFDNPLNRLNNATAVAHGLLIAQREQLKWLIVVGGFAIRLYPVDPDTGVGRKGQTQTFLELDLAILPDDLLGFLPHLFSPGSLVDDGTISQLLDESLNFATGLADRLRDRIYESLIPTLAVSVANRMNAAEADVESQRALLDEAFHQTMIILFRLLFVAYAEDRRLLPYEVSEKYTRNALKTHAKDFAADPRQEFDPNATTLWDDLTQVWKVIDKGDVKGWQVPAYNGGLFTQDAARNPSGAATYSLNLTNDVVGPVLRELLVDNTKDGVIGPVDFRSLSVREFGTIYEGLLESGLDIAATDLALDSSDAYIPATSGTSVVVKAGSVYFHSRSGTRKATGSYFTKPFVVAHLLDTALEPAIDRHLLNVRTLIDQERHQDAARLFFDFRVADLSMGSGHFLVAAIDRVEAKFSRFLAEMPMATVTDELSMLRESATQQLGITAEEAGIDDGLLLRRQIARRCIYGVDLNEIAVELSRLGMWIHTFVPGLPLSFLNHSLVWADSLLGVGTLDEISDAIQQADKRENKADNNFFLFLNDAVSDFLEQSSEYLEGMARLSDLSIADVGKAAEVQKSLETALRPMRDLCDLITAERSTRASANDDPEKVRLTGVNSEIAMATTAAELVKAVNSHPSLEYANLIAGRFRPLHLPVAFPEVFRRENPGFDVIVGNPPWDEVTVEVPKFWRRFYPGLMGLKPDAQKKKIAELKVSYSHAMPQYEAELKNAERLRKTLLALPYPGIGTGDVDLYQIFAWRTWQLLRAGGRLGMVFPRSLLNSAGTAPWREQVLEEGNFVSVVTAINTGKWVFSEVDGRYSIAFVTVERCKPIEDAVVRVAGPFHSEIDFVKNHGDLGALSVKGVQEWATGAAFPLLGSSESVDCFLQLRKHARLDRRTESWDFRPVSELHATNDRKHFDAGDQAPDRFAVYTGSSFDIWTPDTGEYYAWADRQTVIDELKRKRFNQITHAKSAFYGLGEEWASDERTLALWKPRIAFRDITNATNTRTFIAALVPGGHPLTNKAPYFARIAGDERAEAYLLGILCSVPLDWYARRYIELNANLHIVNGFPVPEFSGDSISIRITEIAGRLAAVDDRYQEWASKVGVKVGSVRDDDEKQLLLAELDAAVSIAYGLSPSQVRHIFRTFHRGWDFERRLQAVQMYYTQLKDGVAK